MRWIAIVVLVAVSAGGRAQDLAASALNRIARTPYFAFGGVGDAGVISQGEKDFREMMAEPAPIALQGFEKLYATGNFESKAYALAGIRELNPAEFRQLVDSVQHSTIQISTMEGCIVESQSLARVAANLRSGKYDRWIRRALNR